MRKVRVFRYLPEVDAFEVTSEYQSIAEDLGLVEWNPVVWLGRLFCMDNDFGEHWFDNWEAREERREACTGLGIDPETLLVIDAERFQDGNDGPCNPPQLRARFWREVLECLELSMDLLSEKARHYNAIAKARAHLRDLYIEDLEDRIDRWYSLPEP